MQGQALATTNGHVYQRVLQSNLKPEEKSAIGRWVAEAMQTVTSIRPTDAPGGILAAVRSGSETAAMAIGAAYMHVNAPEGLDGMGVPVDGAAGAGMLAASAFMGHSELGTDARTLGNFGFGLCTFRKMVDVFASQRLASGRALGSHLTPGVRRTPGAPDDPVTEVEGEL